MSDATCRVVIITVDYVKPLFYLSNNSREGSKVQRNPSSPVSLDKSAVNKLQCILQ